MRIPPVPRWSSRSPNRVSLRPPTKGILYARATSPTGDREIVGESASSSVPRPRPRSRAVRLALHVVDLFGPAIRDATWCAAARLHRRPVPCRRELRSGRALRVCIACVAILDTVLHSDPNYGGTPCFVGTGSFENLLITLLGDSPRVPRHFPSVSASRQRWTELAAKELLPPCAFCSMILPRPRGHCSPATRYDCATMVYRKGTG